MPGGCPLSAYNTHGIRACLPQAGTYPDKTESLQWLGQREQGTLSKEASLSEETTLPGQCLHWCWCYFIQQVKFLQRRSSSSSGFFQLQPYHGNQKVVHALWPKEEKKEGSGQQ